MSIAAAVITGIAGIASTLIGGGLQMRTLKRGEAAAKEQYQGELAESARRFNLEAGLSRQSLSLQRQNLAEEKRQFNESLGLKQTELAMTKNEYARNAFREQVKNLTGILDKNEQLKDLYINRLKGLRN
jgi:5-bromo-4-chloroindolyl phosphate hydrolysis protein